MGPEQEVEPWGDLEGWEQLWEDVRSAYSLDQVRQDLRRPLKAGEIEAWTDPVLLTSFLLTEQILDLSATREWFLERLGIDRPSEGNATAAGSPQAALQSIRTDGPKACRTAASPPHHQHSVSPPKITRKPFVAEKALSCPTEKTPACPPEKSPSYYLPVSLWVVLDKQELRELLLSHGQAEWASKVRLSGLLILLDFMIRNTAKDGLQVSNVLSHQYASALKRARSERTLAEPLAVLEKIGIITKLRKAAVSAYTKSAAAYRIAGAFLRRKREIEVLLPPKVHHKRLHAYERREQRLNAKHPCRANLLRTLATVSLSTEGLKVALDLGRQSGTKNNSTVGIAGVISGKKDVSVGFTPSGQITTSFSSCPRELKPHLTIDGKEVAHCDISHAHFCILPRLLLDRIDRELNRAAGERDAAPLLEEHRKLVEFLSSHDIYRELSEDSSSEAARSKTKASLLAVLNWRNTWARKDPGYQRLKERFPETIRTVEDIKQLDYKAIQAPLRHYTAEVINSALLRLQALGVPGIPDTDSIICPVGGRELTTQIIGEEMFAVTGVRCLVGGVRFKLGTQGVPPCPCL